MRVKVDTEANARRSFLRAAAAVASGMLTITVAGRASAQSMIETLRILCVAGPGSAPDFVARRVAEQLSGRLAKNAIVDNRPGATGRIAVSALKLAPTDGSTLLLAGAGVSAINPLVHANLDYDPAVDLQPVSLVAEMPMALAVGPAVPDSVGNVAELLAWMRANPRLANVGSPGVGSMPHLVEAMLFRESDVPWQHVAFSGGPPAIVAGMGGQIAALVLPAGVLRQHLAGGRLRLLATSGAQRSLYLPAVATLAEQGFTRLVVLEWSALFMHGRAPAAMAEAASQAVQAAVARPELVAAFAQWGMVAVSSTPAALGARIAAEGRHWAPLILAAAIRAE
jgi:tripartite-type tricarboxylate transporter receptor subunit TctC